MTREKLLAQLLIEGVDPGPLPGIPYDSPADQAARRDVLRAEVRAADKYRPGKPRRIVGLLPAQCAVCGSHEIAPPRPVVAA